MNGSMFTYLVAPILGWMTALALSVVVYLVILEINEIRHHRRINAERKRLGLNPV